MALQRPFSNVVHFEDLYVYPKASRKGTRAPLRNGGGMRELLSKILGTALMCVFACARRSETGGPYLFKNGRGIKRRFLKRGLSKEAPLFTSRF